MPLVFAPTGNSFAARYNAESGFLIAPQRPSLGFNEHPMVDRYILGGFKPGIKMYPNQTGKGSISLAQKLSQDDSTRRCRRCPQNCESTCETYTPLDPSNLVKTTFADPQSPSEGINESSTGKPGETKEKNPNFKSLCCSKSGHVGFQHAERRMFACPADALGQQRKLRFSLMYG